MDSMTPTGFAGTSYSAPEEGPEAKERGRSDHVSSGERGEQVIGSGRAGDRRLARHRAGGGDVRSPRWGTAWQCITAIRRSSRTRPLHGLDGVGHLVVQAELADPEAVRRMVDDAVAGLGTSTSSSTTRRCTASTASRTCRTRSGRTPGARCWASTSWARRTSRTAWCTTCWGRDPWSDRQRLVARRLPRRAARPGVWRQQGRASTRSRAPWPARSRRMASR